IWEGLAREIGEDIGFARTGVLYLAESEAQLAKLAEWLDVAAQHQLDSRILSGHEVDVLVTDKRGQWRGGLWTASDGRAEPFKAVPALARTLVRFGGAIREDCAVRSLDLAAGRIAGVVTEHGRVRAQSVVCAAGAWSTLFLRHHGIRLPQLTVRSTVARTARAPDVFSGAAALGEVAIRRRMDGGYTVAAGGETEHFVGADTFRHFFKFLPAVSGRARSLRLRFGDGLLQRLTASGSWDASTVSPFEKTRVLNPPPSKRALERMRRGLARRLPTLASIDFEETWAGMIDVTPDVVPVLDEVRAWPGLFLATGFSGHGFGIGPGAGRVMADMVQGRPVAHDLARFRLSRFSDGSPMRPGPGL
ncbi:MAG: FAD-binding oxidoreductase, partial [Gammaproteobacteria bacterium]